MNFTSHDKKILVGSFIVVLFMSLVFPALGLTSDSAEKSGVPELDVNRNNIEVVSERPEYPRTPTQGTLRYSIPREYPVTTQIGENSSGYIRSVSSFCWNDDPVSEDCVVRLAVFVGTGETNADEHVINESDFTNRTSTVLTAENEAGNEWKVKADFVEMSGWNSTNLEYKINWEIIQKPDEGGDGGLTSLPVVGGIFSAGEALAQILAWIGQMIFWFLGWIVELVVNAVLVLVNSVLFGIDIVSYMTSNYSAMVSDTSGFASFILIIPIVMLSVELLKLGLIFISVLPTT